MPSKVKLVKDESLVDMCITHQLVETTTSYYDECFLPIMMPRTQKLIITYHNYSIILSIILQQQLYTLSLQIMHVSLFNWGFSKLVYFRTLCYQVWLSDSQNMYKMVEINAGCQRKLTGNIF